MAQLNPNGSVAGNVQNIPEAHVPRTRSTFPLKRHFFNTHRFGEYIPHFVADLNKDEDFPINSSSSLRTYTLKSPLMQNVTRNKDYFLVPMEAILPLNWEKFFDNPVRGDDVLDDVGPSVENFWSKVASFVGALKNSWEAIVSDNTTTANQLVQATLRYLVLVEYFYSNGNLLSSLGCHGSPYSYIEDDYGTVVTFDDFFDAICKVLIENFLVSSGGNYLGTFTIEVDGYIYVVSAKETEYGFDAITFRHMLQLIRENPTFKVTGVSYGSVALSSVITALGGIINDWTLNFRNANVPCNLSRLWAYQLSVAHYMTNDHIDFVYSAELYRQLIGAYIIQYGGGSLQSWMFFTRNGLKYQYDYLSAKVFSSIIGYASSNLSSSLLTSTTASSAAYAVLGYFSALFGYRRSLRYLDYFTGSRAQPLAVVGSGSQGFPNTNVAVSSNQVSVIDITKSIQAQRFLNSVNRVRHNFEGYLKGIFGGEVPAPDYHNPFKIAHCDDVVFGQETENTADAQMKDSIAITTNLRGSGKYMFEIHTDRPCIAIGITSYEIPRIYTKSMDRTFLHINRFDWFNPFMQYIGDQPIYLQELGIKPGSSALDTMANFSYAIRHEEYKQWFNIASGGFAVPSTNLDNWIFIARDRRGTQANINPDWIRSLNAEFDNFFVSLSGFSLGTYFHFIVDDFNSCNASRPMAFAPQILG